MFVTGQVEEEEVVVVSGTGRRGIYLHGTDGGLSTRTREVEEVVVLVLTGQNVVWWWCS